MRLSIRQRKIPKVNRTNPKILMLCVDGPYEGKKIWLSKDRPSTAEFSVYGEKGRYVPQREGKHNIESKDKVTWVKS